MRFGQRPLPSEHMMTIRPFHRTARMVSHWDCQLSMTTAPDAFAWQH